MTSLQPRADVRAHNVEITKDELTVELADGRRVSVPLTWFPRLLHASNQAREKWELMGDGEGIHWPDADEDISIEGLLRGTSSVEMDSH